MQAVLAGVGIQTSYDRLREACQTDVDGTSIDAVEEALNELGVCAEQVMVPLNHVLVPEVQSLPAIIVVERPNGMMHFVVVWRRHGKLLQVMDPAHGRRWVNEESFLKECCEHEFEVAAVDWRDWASSASFLDAQRFHLRRMGIKLTEREKLVENALADPSWRGLAALDAAVRLTSVLHRSGVFQKGAQAHRTIVDLMDQVSRIGVDAVPDEYWSVRSDTGESANVVIRGAVLIRVSNREQDSESSSSILPTSPELAAALNEKTSSPIQAFWQLVRDDSLRAAFAVVGLIALVAIGVLVEALLFRTLLGATWQIGTWVQRAEVASAIVSFVALMLVFDWPIASLSFRIGRRIENRLRIAFLKKLPKISDRYFASRLISDLAERSHTMHKLRDFPILCARFLELFFRLLFIVIGLSILASNSALIIVILGVFSLFLPLVFHSAVVEKDLRVRSHVGALSRYYLDALLGLTAIRTHGAERSIRRGHESLVRHWSEARTSLSRVTVLSVALTSGLTILLTIWLVYDQIDHGTAPPTVLLLIFWSLQLPVLGQEIGQIVLQYPALRNIVLRLVEPLGADEEAQTEIPDGKTPHATGSGPAISMEKVEVQAGGHQILKGIDLHISPGEHVAIVGTSGAGKSTLVSLLLGWHRASSGSLLVGGLPVNAKTLPALRKNIAWLDPGIQLWNESLLRNLLYGSDAQGIASIGRVLKQANLGGIVQRFVSGLQTNLGEGGGLVSGGEGQRVRFGRALGRPHAGLVVLDEPFRGLPRKQREKMLEVSRYEWATSTLLYVSHDITSTRDFPRVLVVENGQIVEDLDPSKVGDDDSTRYAELLRSEKAVHQSLWSAIGWRQCEMVAGQLVEEPKVS